MERKQLRDIYTSQIIGISPDAPLADAARLMEANRISCILALRGRKPVGIITERNIVRFAAGRWETIRDVPVREVMSTPVITAGQDTEILEAYNLFTTHAIRHLVIVDHHGNAAGIVTQSDIIPLLSLESFIEFKSVSQVMSKVVFCLPKEVPVTRALREMADRSVSCMIIVDDDHPIGILTERDAARLLFCYDDLATVKIGAVMSTSVETTPPDTPLADAVGIMRSKKLRRLVVVDARGNIEGIATQSDLTKGLEGKHIEKLNKIITEKNRIIHATANSLAEKTIYLQNLLRSSADYGIIAVNFQFSVIFFNRGAEIILHRDSRGATGIHIRNLLVWEATPFPDPETILRELHSGQKPSFTVNKKIDGLQQYIRVTASLITDTEDNPIGFYLLLRDITKQTHAEKKLAQANKHLENRVKERTRQLEKAMHGTINAMALTIEMRDPYTSGHQRRVADLAVCIGKILGLPQEKIEGLYMAGLIHDLGKIRVPSGILCHTGKLSDAEYAILKPHPVIGHSILKGIEFPWPIADIVLQHHERIDGSGYPLGLRGDAILIKAKILAVADVVEAMSSHRPYRPSLGIESALDEIRTRRGITFDANVVDACLHLFTKENYCFPSPTLCIVS